MPLSFHPILPPGFTMMVLSGMTSIRSPQGWILQLAPDTTAAKAGRRYQEFLRLHGITDEVYVHPKVANGARSEYVITIDGRVAQSFAIHRYYFKAN